MNKEKLQQLHRQMDELMKWKDSITNQQFQLPVGFNTKKIINKDKLVFTGNVYENTVPFTFSLEIQVDSRTFWIPARLG